MSTTQQLRQTATCRSKDVPAALVCTAMDGTAPPTITLPTPNARFYLSGDSKDERRGHGSSLCGCRERQLVGRFNTAEVFYTQTCTGGAAANQCQGTAPATWSTRVATTSTFYPDHTSVVSIGTTVYFAGANATSVATWSLAFGSATIPKAYQIDSTISGTAAPVSISEYGTGNTLGTGNKLAVFYGTITSVYFTKSSTETAWSTRQTVTTSETHSSASQLSSMEHKWEGSGAAPLSPFTIRLRTVEHSAFQSNTDQSIYRDTSTTQTATSSSVRTNCSTTWVSGGTSSP